MLPLFNSLLAQIIVLALLLVLLTAPFLALWIALSIRRDVHRMADAIDFNTDRPSTSPTLRELPKSQEQERVASRISNSAFGR